VLIVLDTNVLVSGLLNPFGSPARVVDQVTLNVVQVAYDDRIIAEYIDVLSRPAFGFPKKNVQDLVEHIKLSGIHVVAKALGLTENPDPGDLPFAEVAITARVDAVVTGNLSHFQYLEKRGVSALSPSEFIETAGRLFGEAHTG
jgi:putative PIN family toxin of toxin-antitoxin system